MRAHRKRYLQFAVTQNFHAIALRPHDAALRKNLRRDRIARREQVERLDVDDRKSLRRRAREAPLWQAPVERHLAAFKSGAARIAAPGLLSLVARASCFPHLRAHAA